MSTYVITTDVNGSITVQSGQINTTQTSLNLVGRGAAGYGLAIASNTIKHVSNFASPTAPANPLIGQLWFDFSLKSLKVYVSSVVGWSEIPSANSLSSSFLTRDELFGPGSNSTTPLRISRGGTGLTTVGPSGSFLMSNGTSLVWSDAINGALTNALRRDVSTAPISDSTVALGTTGLRFSEVCAVQFKGVAIQAQYADIAERYEIDTPGEPGDVVEMGGTKEIRKSSSNSDMVVGVISTDPAVKLNAAAGTDETHPYIALVGRTPCKVIGKVMKGQRLVSSEIPGTARAADANSHPFQVIGRSIENKFSDGVELIEVIVGAK